MDRERYGIEEVWFTPVLEVFWCLSENYPRKSKLIVKTVRDPCFFILTTMAAMPLQARPQGITFDEYGRPFIILKEQDRQTRLTGLDAQKVILE